MPERRRGRHLRLAHGVSARASRRAGDAGRGEARADESWCWGVRRKENTVLRGALNPSIVHVIPNAVVASHFRPAEPTPPVPEISQSATATATATRTGQADPSHPFGLPVTIVCISRLVYRKGIDLLIAALPKVCALHPDVRFLIGQSTKAGPQQRWRLGDGARGLTRSRLDAVSAGGDGPKIVELDQMRDKHQTLLRDRVDLLGSVRPENVRDVSSSSRPRSLPPPPPPIPSVRPAESYPHRPSLLATCSSSRGRRSS